MRNFKYGHILDVLALLAVAGALPVFPAHAGQGVGYTQQRGLTLAILNRIALGAIEACEAKGYTVSATIVDREGVTRVSLMGDGAGPVSVSTSYRKAYTAAALGITTAKFREMVETPGAGPILSIDPLLMPFSGGVPIKIGNRVVAAVGVGGADRSGVDEDCAAAGVALVQKDLN